MVTWEQIRQYFERDGLNFVERDGETKVLEAEMRLTETSLQLRVVYDEQNGVVRFVVPDLDLPRRLPRNRHELRKALLLLNSCYILGSFTESPQGRVSFEITVLIEGNELPYPVHRRMLGAVLASVDRALPWLRQVAMGALSAEEAVENIADASRRVEGETDADDPPGFSGGGEVGKATITEEEIERFARALLNGGLPSPEA